MMRIKFHGFLKRLCPKEYYEIDAQTPAEAIRGLTNQMKQLIRVGGNRWVCRVKECPNREDLYAINPELKELNLYPDYMPAGTGKTGGWVQIVVGVVLIVIGIALCCTGSPWAGAGLIVSGSGMIFTGVATLLMKVPDSDEGGDSNKYFGSGGNTTKIGTRIAIGYGKYKFYGQLLSVTTESSEK